MNERLQDRLDSILHLLLPPSNPSLPLRALRNADHLQRPALFQLPPVAISTSRLEHLAQIELRTDLEDPPLLRRDVEVECRGVVLHREEYFAKGRRGVEGEAEIARGRCGEREEEEGREDESGRGRWGFPCHERGWGGERR